ncbi:transposase [Flavivirga aquatica]|uniref:transposase n=1 Tax=Flavivirga aquatica TaxID=1849968 RepID=UPI0009F4D23C
MITKVCCYIIFVFPIKYRRDVLINDVYTTLKKICQEIENRYEIHFLEIGLDDNHSHFLIQSVTMVFSKENIEYC